MSDSYTSKPGLPDSKNFYRLLESVFAEAEQQICAVGVTEAVCFTIYGGKGWHDDRHIEIKISSGFGSSETRVGGRDIWQLLAEFIRRKGFDQQQSRLSLGAPQIDYPTEGDPS